MEEIIIKYYIIDKDKKEGLKMEITYDEYDELIENLGYGDYLESW